MRPNRVTGAHPTLASDVLLTVAVLDEMSFDLDMGRFRDQFDELGMSVIKLVTEAHADNQQPTQGASLVRSLSALLASGQWRLKRSLKARTPTSNRGTGAGSRLPHWAVFRSRPAERA